ncbi:MULTISPECIES: hypothetical protein [Pseudoalteromonas]|uniref:hypothetical protein n=1 Tax=Pseudoalteromonas TaxID=53246 RepID=UPI001C946AC8|nr:hypothetical protein [Pseudoalteromonas piscicida]QZO13783.1 hypothetical protein K5642_04520 [Pseudoalteromonas piscicida]
MTIKGIFKAFTSNTEEQHESESVTVEPELKVHTIGTDFFVVDSDSLFDSKTVQEQASAAGKTIGHSL